MSDNESELSSLTVSQANSPRDQNSQDKGQDVEMEAMTSADHTIATVALEDSARSDVEMQGISAAAPETQNPIPTESELGAQRQPVSSMNIVKFTEGKLKAISQIRNAYDTAKKAQPRPDLRPKMLLLQQLPWSTTVVTSDGTLSEWLSTQTTARAHAADERVCQTRKINLANLFSEITTLQRLSQYTIKAILLVFKKDSSKV